MATRILIADDEQDIAAILEKKLKQKGFEVLALARGSEVLAQARSFKPDLLILDIAMPDTNGYEAAKAVRQDPVFKKTPIIFMTGQDLESAGILSHAQELGYADFVNKPCTFDELLEKVNSAFKA